MDDPTTWDWCYRTLIKGHEGPLLVVLILMIAGVLFMAWKGWIRIGPPRVDDEKVFAENGSQPKMSHETRRHLYQADGTTKYVPRTECIGNQEDCQNGICERIEEVKSLVVAANSKVDTATKERSEELRNISEFMGKTKEFMEHTSKDVSDIRAALLVLARR